MKFIIMAALILVGGTTPVMADYHRGMGAYENKDTSTALHEFKISAEQGDADSQWMLGFMYAEGEGVLQDYVQAHKWLNLSASRGNKRAKQARDIIAAKMTPDQIAQAQKMAREWKPTKTTLKSEGPERGSDDIISRSSSRPSREDIRKIQTILHDLGYDPGVPDGIMGSKTRSAIRSYQADTSLMVDGKASKELLLSLQDSQTRAGISHRATGKGTESSPKDDARQIQDLTESLRDLTEEAAQNRSADPWVINRLRDLVKQYGNPWPVNLFEDRFSDGNYTLNPTWTVAAGQFFVSPQGGLVSRVTVNPAQREEEPKTTNQDLPMALLGAFLKQMDQEEPNKEKPVAEPYGEIHTDQGITNAFDITITITSDGGQGRLEFGPYQGADRASGYRLVYNPGGENAFELLRLVNSLTAVMETYNQSVKMEDGKGHSLRWTRGTEGDMAVFLDGQSLFRAVDRRFTGDFDGFTLVNHGGDYTIRGISASGTKAMP